MLHVAYTCMVYNLMKSLISQSVFAYVTPAKLLYI